MVLLWDFESMMSAFIIFFLQKTPFCPNVLRTNYNSNDEDFDFKSRII